MLSDDLRAGHVIGKADDIRNLELVPVPVRYRENVLTNLDRIECPTPPV